MVFEINGIAKNYLLANTVNLFSILLHINFIELAVIIVGIEKLVIMAT